MASMSAGGMVLDVNVQDCAVLVAAVIQGVGNHFSLGV